MQKAVLITVRSGSTRLPHKALLEIDGLKTIEFVIQNAKRSVLADVVVICTTALDEDDVFEEIAAKWDVECYRGSVSDKLVRWMGAVRKYDIDCFVTADGDDLFCEATLMDKALAQLEHDSVDFIHAPGIVCGAFTYGVKSTALEKVCSLKTTDDTEMMWVFFTESGLFNVGELGDVPSHYYRDDIRMTLDYEEDLEFFKEVILKIRAEKGAFELDSVLNIIDHYPDIKQINFFRQSEFLENQRKNTKLMMCVENE